MSQFKSIKDIIQSHDFLEVRAKSQKYVKKEFQDYAYRLAADLGDLAHRSIYMRLAKTVDRTLLEQAAVFALEYYQEKNKGKLFMWKLAQLRKQAQRQQDLTNVDNGFVMRKMARLYDDLAPIVVAKQQKEFDEERQRRLRQFASAALAPPKGRKQPQVLDLGCGAGLDTRFLGNFFTKVHAVDISKVLVRKAKKIAPKARIITKVNFLEAKYKPEQFSGIWCPRFWPIVPLEAEADYLARFSKLLVSGGTLYLEVLVGAEGQKWQEFTWQEETYIRFEKHNALKALTALCDTHCLILTEICPLSASHKGLIFTKA